ncbi:MAG: hypothetical protein NWE98_01775 [Candidatus Bathyarchaeota archaeon]|nr:hypothetical protein [Candidatus Bathyarchaeota archaeon]
MLNLLSSLLNPTGNLTISVILGTAFILGFLHGITPDEHTWPITFSYAIGSYSTRGGMKSGFMFSLGFIVQRGILTTLGFLGLAAIYQTYDLNGPVYIVVGAVMIIAGSYIIKGRYLHLPFDFLLERKHHTMKTEKTSFHETDLKPIQPRLAVLHGFIAGWGFGAYSTIITFILTPQLPGLIYAPLPGLVFGFGTMCMQIVLGGVFANIMRVKHLTVDQIKYVGRSAAGRTLYYGGALFAIIGILITAFPILDKIAINTGSTIPNLNSINISTFLVIVVIGLIGFGSIYRAFKDINKSKHEAKSR